MTEQYERVATLHGPKDAVLSVSFSPDGRFIVANGFNGVSVWALQGTGFSQVSHPFPFTMTSRNVFPVSSWLCFKKPAQTVLLLGSQEGKVHALDFNPHKAASIYLDYFAPQTPAQQPLCLSVYESTVDADNRGRIVAAFDDKSIVMWMLPAVGEFKHRFSVKLDIDSLPKSVRFAPQAPYIYIFSLQGGQILLLERSSGAVVWKKNRGPTIMSNVSLDSSGDYFVTHTRHEFEKYELSTLNLVQTYSDSPPVVFFPKQIIFAEGDTRVVGGTDRGEIVIYNARNGELVQKLPYPKGGLVQSVSALTQNSKYYLALAGSSSQRCSDVVIYRK
ncbi:YVTN repeat-like/Quino protein amine dehydrogenase, partial [Gymnopus androsaceus JB14]